MGGGPGPHLSACKPGQPANPNKSWFRNPTLRLSLPEGSAPITTLITMQRSEASSAEGGECRFHLMRNVGAPLLGHNVTEGLLKGAEYSSLYSASLLTEVAGTVDSEASLATCIKREARPRAKDGSPGSEIPLFLVASSELPCSGHFEIRVRTTGGALHVEPVTPLERQQANAFLLAVAAVKARSLPRGRPGLRRERLDHALEVLHAAAVPNTHPVAVRTLLTRNVLQGCANLREEATRRSLEVLGQSPHPQTFSCRCHCAPSATTQARRMLLLSAFYAPPHRMSLSHVLATMRWPSPQLPHPPWVRTRVRSPPLVFAPWRVPASPRLGRAWSARSPRTSRCCRAPTTKSSRGCCSTPTDCAAACR